MKSLIFHCLTDWSAVVCLYVYASARTILINVVELPLHHRLQRFFVVVAFADFLLFHYTCSSVEQLSAISTIFFSRTFSSTFRSVVDLHHTTCTQLPMDHNKNWRAPLRADIDVWVGFDFFFRLKSWFVFPAQCWWQVLPLLWRTHGSVAIFQSFADQPRSATVNQLIIVGHSWFGLDIVLLF